MHYLVEHFICWFFRVAAGACGKRRHDADRLPGDGHQARPHPRDRHSLLPQGELHHAAAVRHAPRGRHLPMRGYGTSRIFGENKGDATFLWNTVWPLCSDKNKWTTCHKKVDTIIHGYCVDAGVPPGYKVSTVFWDNKGDVTFLWPPCSETESLP